MVLVEGWPLHDEWLMQPLDRGGCPWTMLPTILPATLPCPARLTREIEISTHDGVRQMGVLVFSLRRSLQPRADMSSLLSHQLNYVSVISDRKNPEACVCRSKLCS